MQRAKNMEINPHTRHTLTASVTLYKTLRWDETFLLTSLLKCCKNYWLLVWEHTYKVITMKWYLRWQDGSQYFNYHICSAFHFHSLVFSASSADESLAFMTLWAWKRMLIRERPFRSLFRNWTNDDNDLDDPKHEFAISRDSIERNKGKGRRRK